MRVSKGLVPGGLCLLLVGFASVHGARSESQEKGISLSANPASTSEYLELIQEGEKKMAAGELKEALLAFELASDEELKDAPNYEVLSRIAEVRCKQGDRKGGEAVLTGFQCALQVASGEAPCFVENDEPNPKLSEDCLERMCDDFYASYYDNKGRMSRIEELKKEAERVGKVCGK